MSQSHVFRIGDGVVHPRRPEWGRGTVRQARVITHEGTRAQRLTVDFAHHGRTVINTAIAPLQPKGKEPATMSSSTTSAGGWLGQLERSATGKAQTHELWDLPEALTDPFVSDLERLKAILATYRFSTEPRSLLEWAVTQTGLSDPMTKYTRQEMEQAFPRFARDRDQHLKQLVFQLKRSAPGVLKQAERETRLPAAQSALAKAMR